MEKRAKNVIIVRGRGIEPAVNKMAYTLSQNGYTVDLFLWDRQRNVKVDEVIGFSVHRCTFRAPYDSPLVMVYLPVWWMYEFIYLMKNNCSIIHACDIDTIVPAVLAKMVKNVRLVYTIYDFYADCLPERTPKLVRKLIALFDKTMIRFADTLILVDKTRYAQVNGAKIGKIEYICNTPPDSHEIPGNSDHGPDSFTLFYAGAFLQDRGLNYVLEAVKDIPQIQVIIAGFGPELDTVVGYTKKDPERIHYLGILSYDEVIEKTFRADMLFAFYDPSIPNNRYASPNKLFEAMMCGKPIITNAGTSMAEIVRIENCGLIVPYGDISAIKDAIHSLRDSPDLCKQLGANGRKAYEEKYSWGIMEKRLLAVYKDLNEN